ncbi:MAG: extracellular solute-binding protein [Alphaproteobacteria bacterium]|nr:extracellular solute-binding protein [Alphaproteobacteria bacterium]
MAGITRRRLLRTSGVAAAAAASGGLAAVVAARRAPAFAQGTALHWLKPPDYVPASDELLRKKLLPECEKALGIKITLETIDGNGIQARTTSSIQSGAGPDVICEINNWAQLYADSVVDVTDVCDEIAKAQGGFYEESKAIGNDGKRWIAVPFTILGILLANRKTWWEEAGYGGDKYPRDWEGFRAAGKKLKGKDHPIGQTLAHTYGDAPAFWYPYLWSWGGKEVEADGKTVVLNSKETVESVKFATAFWKECCDEGALAWDDSGNNRAFLSGTISATANAASIYIEAKKKPDSYQTDKGTPMKDDIFHAPLPSGPAGQFSYHVPFANVILRYSKNEKAAKDFLRSFHSNPVYDEWFTSQQGFSAGTTTMWEGNKVWNDDPIMAPFRTSVRSGRFAGYAGPSLRPAAEAISKYIIVDMYAKAVQGMPPEDAVKWAHQQLAGIYA